MRKVKFSYRMELQFSQPVWQHCFSLLAFPMRLPEQQIGGFRWSLQPEAGLQFHQDYFGNTVGTGRFDAPHSSFQYEMSGVAWLGQQRRRAEACLPLYRYPSAACSVTVPMQEFLLETMQKPAQPLQVQTQPLQNAVQLMEALYHRFRYQAGSTMISTTAGEAFAQGCGVCQDYAQILITLCRASGIAARYVAGIIPGEGESHAWVEVYDNGLWHGLDPTQNKMVDDGYLKLAQGRDYMDCRLNRGVFCGRAVQQQNVNVSLEEL